jgi:SpoVK/Ycf46/Vps4 family AAA+-type ATPase
MKFNVKNVLKMVSNYEFINKDNFISGLQELDELIGLEETKSLILEQIVYILTTPGRNNNMLHTLIMGPIGGGKTTLAKILAKLWHSMGLFKYSPESENNLLLEKFQVIKDKVDVIKELLPNNVLHMKEKGNLQEEPILWRLDKIIDICNQSEKELQKIPCENTPKFITTTREDFIGKYVGYTQIMTKKILQKAIGGVLFVDEAHRLMSSDNDEFGVECLSTINNFLIKHPGEIIIIFSSSDGKIIKNIFDAQPGLNKYFNWNINTKPYTPIELSQIIIKQFNDESWSVANDVTIDWLSNFISNKSKHFTSTACDTKRLVFYSIKEHAIRRKVFENVQFGVITRDMITSAFNKCKTPYIPI